MGAGHWQWQRLPAPLSRLSGRHCEGMPWQSLCGLVQFTLGKKHLHDGVLVQPLGHEPPPGIVMPPSAAHPGQSGGPPPRLMPPDDAAPLLLPPLELPPPPPPENVEGPDDEEQAATSARASANVDAVRGPTEERPRTSRFRCR
jgi:hypothetical protein